MRWLRFPVLVLLLALVSALCGGQETSDSGDGSVPYLALTTDTVVSL